MAQRSVGLRVRDKSGRAVKAKVGVEWYIGGVWGAIVVGADIDESVRAYMTVYLSNIVSILILYGVKKNCF